MLGGENSRGQWSETHGGGVVSDRMCRVGCLSVVAPFDRCHKGRASRRWRSGVGCVGRVACDEFGFSRRKHLEKKNLKVKNLEKDNLEKENGEG